MQARNCDRLKPVSHDVFLYISLYLYATILALMHDFYVCYDALFGARFLAYTNQCIGNDDVIGACKKVSTK